MRVNDGGMFNDFFIANFAVECYGKRILKICQDLEKLWQKINWHFFRTWCSYD